MSVYCMAIANPQFPADVSKVSVFVFEDTYKRDSDRQERISKLLSSVRNRAIYHFSWDSQSEALEKFASMGVCFTRILKMGDLRKWEDLHDVFNRWARFKSDKGFYTISGYDSEDAEWCNLGNDSIVSQTIENDPISEIPF